MLPELRRLVLATLLSLAALCACGDPAPTAAPVPGAEGEVSAEGSGVEAVEPADDEDEGSAPPPALPDAAKLKAEHTKRLAEMNEYGRGLLESFESRVYAPPRDGRLKTGRAVVAVRVGEVEAAFVADFDASRPEDERVVVTAGDDNPDVPPGTDMQVKKWARISFEGPYREVVHYLPPTGVLVTPSKDKLHRVVTAQPHKHNVQVSYSVDERDMVMIRGTSVIPQAEIVRFTWELWRGRQLLDGMTFRGTDTTVEFEYDDKNPTSLVLLKRARLTQADKAFDAAFRYEDLTFDE